MKNKLENEFKFEELCLTLDQIAASTNYQEKSSRISELLEKWRSSGDDIYPLMRLIVRHLDRARSTYKMQQATLRDCYAKVLNISKNSEQMKYIKGIERSANDLNDSFFGRLSYIIKDHVRQGPGHVTISQINEKLDELHNSPRLASRAEVIKWFVTECTAREHYWIWCIILDQIRLGIRETKILDLYHQDAQSHIETYSDLASTCRVCYDKNRRIVDDSFDSEGKAGHQAKLKPFQPFLLQHLKRAISFKEIVDHVPAPFYIQKKLDGYKIVLHKVGSEFRYFTRNRFDFTSRFGTSAPLEPVPLTMTEMNAKDFSYYAAQCLAPTVRSCIIEGELLAYNKKLKTFELFESLSARRTAVGTCSYDLLDSKLQDVLIAFDVLYLNGDDLRDVQYRRRHELLAKMIRPSSVFVESGTVPSLQCLDNVEGHTAEDIERALENVRDEGGEGLVIRDPRAAYVINERSWQAIKVKPDYLGHIPYTLDCLIVGAYLGRGSYNQRTLSSFLCAVKCDMALGSTAKADGAITAANGSDSGSNKSADWVILCAVTKKLKHILCDRFPLNPLDADDPSGNDSYWTPSDQYPDGSPSWCRTSSVIRKPDFWLSRIQDGVVAEIKMSAIIPSPHYPLKLTARFPVIYKIRDLADKDYNDCNTAKDVVEMNIAQGSLSNLPRTPVKSGKRPRASEQDSPKSPTSSLTKKVPNSSKVAPAARNVELDRTAVFGGKAICVAFVDECPIGIEHKLAVFGRTSDDASDASYKHKLAKLADEWQQQRSLPERKSWLSKLIARFHGSLYMSYVPAKVDLVVSDWLEMAPRSAQPTGPGRVPCNIATTWWVLTCIACGKELPLTPPTAHTITPETRSLNRGSRLVDSMGDSFTAPVSMAEMRILLQMDFPCFARRSRLSNAETYLELQSDDSEYGSLMAVLAAFRADEQRHVDTSNFREPNSAVLSLMKAADSAIFPDAAGINEFRVFRSFNCVAFISPGIDCYLKVKHCLHFYGARISRVIDSSVTHIIATTKPAAAAAAVELDAFVVKPNWVFSTIAQKKRASETLFLL